MGVPKDRLMRKNSDGTKEQIYPMTHIDAVKGLDDFIEGTSLKIGVNSVNGIKGDVSLPVLSESDYSTMNILIDAYNRGIFSDKSITVEKVGEVK